MAGLAALQLYSPASFAGNVEDARAYQETPADRNRFVNSICDTDNDPTNNGTIRRIPKTQCEGPAIKPLRDAQSVIKVPYTNFQGEQKTGFLVIPNELTDSARTVFEQLQTIGFRINSVIPVSEFNWKDSESMAADNSSGFNPRCGGEDNYRVGCGLSKHSSGKAIDFNPVENPFYTKGRILPIGAKYITSVMGTVTGQVVQVLENNGWTNWGGYWNEKDYQHFQHQ